MKRIFILIILTLFLNNINAQQAYDARISEKEILTPVPNNEPKINARIAFGLPSKLPFENLPAGRQVKKPQINTQDCLRPSLKAPL